MQTLSSQLCASVGATPKIGGRTAKEFAEGREFESSTLVYCARCLRTGLGGAPRSKKREPHVRMVRVVPSAVRTVVSTRLFFS